MRGFKKEKNHSSAQECNKSFWQSGDFKTHERTRTREKPFQCSKCNKSFMQSGDLQTHERTRTGEKPFQCTKCEKSFSDPSAFETHERTHTGEKPLHWLQCHYSAKMHERTYTREKPFKFWVLMSWVAMIWVVVEVHLQHDAKYTAWIDTDLSWNGYFILSLRRFFRAGHCRPCRAWVIGAFISVLEKRHSILMKSRRSIPMETK